MTATRSQAKKNPAGDFDPESVPDPEERSGRKAAAEKSLEKIAPHSIEAEINLLGAILYDNDALDDVGLVLKPRDFYSANNEKIYRLILEHYERSQTVDPVILIDALKKRGWLETVGGEAYVATLAAEVFSSHHAAEYARIVREKSVRRYTANVGRALAARALDDGTESAEELLDLAVSGLIEVQGNVRPNSSSPVSEAVASVIEELASEEAPPGVMSGFTDIDEFTNGFRPGEVTILAARPSVGKTTLALNIAKHAAESGAPVLFFSLEMTREQLVHHLLACQAKVDADVMMKKRLNDNDWSRIQIAAGEIGYLPIEIAYAPGLKPGEALAVARKWAREKKVERGRGLVVLDYLQLMEADDSRKFQNRETEVAGASRALKNLAGMIGVPLLMLAQINRDIERRGGGIPRLSDLRESGAIEQDADAVMFLHNLESRQEKKDEENPNAGLRQDARVQVTIAKQRNGRTGAAHLWFRKHYLEFRNAVEL